MVMGSLKSYGFDKPEFNPERYRVKPEKAQDPLEEIAKALVAGYKGYEGVQDTEQKRRLTDATITYKKEYGDDAMGLAKFKAGAASDLAKQKADASLKLASIKASLAERVKNAPEGSATQKFLSDVLGDLSSEDVSLTEEDKHAVGYLMDAPDSASAQAIANILSGSKTMSMPGKAYIRALNLDMNRLNLYNKSAAGSPESAQFKAPLANTPVVKAPAVSAPVATAPAPSATSKVLPKSEWANFYKKYGINSADEARKQGITFR